MARLLRAESPDDPGGRRRARHAAVLARAGRRVRRRRRRPRPRRGQHRPGQHGHAVLRLRRARLPGRHVHREPQPRALQRHQAVPGGCVADRRRHRPGATIREAVEQGVPAPAAGTVPAASRSGPCSPTTRPTCAAWSTCRRCARCASSSTPATGWPATPCPRCSASLPLDVVPMYFELDGTFPNHEANPLDPANLVDLQKRVVARGRRHRPGLRRRRRPLLRRRRARRARQPQRDHRAGRGPRAGQVARRLGHPQPDHLARRAGDRPRARRHARPHPGRALVHQAGDGRAPARSSAASTPAHYYFRDFWRADSGMLAALHVLAALGEPRRAALGADGRLRALRGVRRGQLDGRRRAGEDRRDQGPLRRARRRRRVDELDGLTIDLPDGSWFNLRPSNTEPLLRLNVEARDAAAMAALRDEVLAVVRA